MKVSLFVSCVVDQVRPDAGLASARVLERAGCEVDFDPRVLCCGQPAYNTGYRGEATALARRFVEVLGGGDHEAVVVPSGSCAAMVHHFAELFEDEPEMQRRAQELAAKTFELGSFLVHRLGVEDVGARFDGRVTWHDACHGLRELGIREEPRRLIRSVRGTELVDLKSCDSCCGFGGTFSVKFPGISVAMLDKKLDEVEASGVDAVVSGDASCLMQIQGRLEHRSSRVRTMHLAELLDAGGAG